MDIIIMLSRRKWIKEKSSFMVKFWRNILKYSACMLACSAVAKTDNAKAELSYSFSADKFVNGLSEQQKQEEDANAKSSKEPGTVKKEPTGNSTENTIKLKIGGLADFQYFFADQQKIYRRDILPNGLPYSPAMIENSATYNSERSFINMLGRIDFNPEFVRKKAKGTYLEGQDPVIMKVGAKLSQPLYKASKNTDPRLAPQEYIYIDTHYLRLELGATKSSAAKMRVDAEKIASGNGGIYGTWWRYVKLPVFNVAGLDGQTAALLNALSPVYMLYPTLPNEAGFTTQRFSVGRQITPAMFNGAVAANNLIYGSSAQPYPTHGAYSNKISLYSKRIKGFKVGISYSPTTADTGYATRIINGNTKTFNNVKGGFVENYMSFAIDYRKQFDENGLGVAFSAAYELGEAQKISYIASNGGLASSVVVSGNDYYKRHNLRAWSVGGQLVYKNYSIAYSYGNWGRSLMPYARQIGFNSAKLAYGGGKSDYHSVGIGATYGPIRISATYMRSNLGGNKMDVWSIGTDYKMISLKYLRVNPYIEYTGYVFHTRNIAKTGIYLPGTSILAKALGNHGTVLTGGIRIVF